MNNDTILDSENLISEQTISKRQLTRKKIKYFIFFITSAIINSVLARIYSEELSYMLPPKGVSSMFFFGCLIWGFILAFIFNFIPYKRISYWKRYLRMAFILAIIWNGILLFFMLYRILFILNEKRIFSFPSEFSSIL